MGMRHVFVVVFLYSRQYVRYRQRVDSYHRVFCGAAVFCVQLGTASWSKPTRKVVLLIVISFYFEAYSILSDEVYKA